MHTELIGTICQVCKKGVIQDKSSDFPYSSSHEGQCDYCFSKFIGKWNKDKSDYEWVIEKSRIAEDLF